MEAAPAYRTPTSILELAARLVTAEVASPTAEEGSSIPSGKPLGPLAVIGRMASSPATVAFLSDALRGCGILAVASTDDASRRAVVAALVRAGAVRGGLALHDIHRPERVPGRPFIVEVTSDKEAQARGDLRAADIDQAALLLVGRDHAGEPAILAVAA